jgi:ABC-type proline/glycine betaine transport system permease subunit
MSDLNVAGRNGKGQLIAEIANHFALVLTARLIATIGVPVVMWVFVEIWNGLKAIESAVRGNQTIIAVQEYCLGQNERRVNVLEQIAREER